MEHLIPQTVEGLKPFDVGYFIAGHCTGWRALHALANAYGDCVSQSAVGTRYLFDASTPPSERTTPAPTSFEAKPSW
jgi:7,8-dihydropterin-6-yl-methyl-4-(beta-D-ribofuranosyl)aminobenzene 5'-phosphate synthase